MTAQINLIAATLILALVAGFALAFGALLGSHIFDWVMTTIHNMLDTGKKLAGLKTQQPTTRKATPSAFVPLPTLDPDAFEQVDRLRPGKGMFDPVVYLETFSALVQSQYVTSERDIARRLLSDGPLLEPFPDDIRHMWVPVMRRMMNEVPPSHWTPRLDAALDQYLPRDQGTHEPAELHSEPAHYPVDTAHDANLMGEAQAQAAAAQNAAPGGAYRPTHFPSATQSVLAGSLAA